MICFVCEKGKLISGPAQVRGSVKGEPYTVEVEALVCTRCGETSLTEAQSGPYSLAIADAYRRAHGLLTTTEIKAARHRLGLTQQQFAGRLKVGIASVKRWELGAIQDESSDRLMRLCTDVDEARLNLRELEALADPTVGRRPVGVARRPPGVSEWPDELTLSSADKAPPNPRKVTPHTTPISAQPHAA